ncbi:hypothetical protein [Nocardia sp. NBC_01327]|uniref:hypothetical protein n=1 Tax=Nocardia sp. NBC_01327 TaxID=2903593 RepID=UPI002E122631|nr:hypothetical protein OG326_21165 [Nocardia sp. NBC_01327]
MICDAEGNVIDQLRPFADALATANSWTLMRWVTSTRSAQRLSQLVAAGTEISHDALDRLPQGHATRYLRELLVSTGVLGPRNEPFAQLVLWTENLTCTLPDPQRRLVRPFAEWSILRDARRRAERGRYTDAASRADRAQIRAAIRFLTWLDGYAIDLDSLDQGALDTYLAANPSQRQTLSAFLRWFLPRITDRKLIFVPHRPNSPCKVQELTDQQHQLRRCLTDASLDLEARVAGTLSRLYALSLQDITTLTIDRYSREGQDSYLTLARHPVLLPPSLARLIEQLIAQPVARALIPATSTSIYLFPGKPATRPRHPRSLQQLLSESGLPHLPARNTAMIAIVSELPSPVVADLLGIHPCTANRWTEIAQTSWAGYLAARDTLKA